MAHISPITVADEATRDALTEWEAGDIVFCVTEGTLSYYDGEAFQTIANLGDLA